MSADSGNNGDRGEYLDWLEAYQTLDDEVAAALGRRKDHRKIGRGKGYDLKAVDMARKLGGLAEDVRARQLANIARYLEWMGKPIGTQSEMFPDGGEQEDEQEVSEAQHQRVRAAGRAAYTEGQSRTVNPWTSGSWLHEVWDEGWAAEASTPADQETEKGEDFAPARPGRRGRPRKTEGAAAV